jgi:hypothetical protein
MVDFGVEYIGKTPGEMEQRLAETSTAGRRRVNNALRETAEEVKDDLEDTSPVDTGEYQDSWYIAPIAENEVWILNEAGHAPYVMLPNSKMIGSSKADLPASGVLHNVKGVARKHSDNYRGNVIDQLQEMIGELSVD